MRERVEEIDPQTLGRPADVAIVKRLLRPIVQWRFDPAPAGFEQMNDPADHPAIVDARLAACVRGKMRLDFRKLRVRQQKAIRNHRRFFSEAVNHNAQFMPSILWVWALNITVAF